MTPPDLTWQIMREAVGEKQDPGPNPIRLSLIDYGQPLASALVPDHQAEEFARRIGAQAHRLTVLATVFATRVPDRSETDPHCPSHQLYPPVTPAIEEGP